MLFGQFYNTFIVFTTQPIKIQRDSPNTLAQSTATGPSKSQIRPFGTHELSPLRQSQGTQCTQPLPLLICSWYISIDILQCLLGKMSVKINHVPTQRSCTALQGRKTLRNTLAARTLHLSEETPPERLFDLTRKGPHQVLLTSPHATTPQGTDSWILTTCVQKAPHPDWTCTPSGDSKVTISQN